MQFTNTAVLMFQSPTSTTRLSDPQPVGKAWEPVHVFQSLTGSTRLSDHPQIGVPITGLIRFNPSRAAHAFLTCTTYAKPLVPWSFQSLTGSTRLSDKELISVLYGEEEFQSLTGSTRLSDPYFCSIA